MQVLIFALAFAEERLYVPAMGPMTPLVAGLPAPVVVGNLPYPRLPGDEVKRASVDSTSITAGGIIVMLAVGAAITKRPAGRPSRGRALRMEEGRDTAVFREEGQEEEDEDDFAAPIRKLNVQYDDRAGLRGGGGVGMGVSGMVFVGLVLGCIEAKFCK